MKSHIVTVQALSGADVLEESKRNCQWSKSRLALRAKERMVERMGSLHGDISDDVGAGGTVDEADPPGMQQWNVRQQI